MSSRESEAARIFLEAVEHYENGRRVDFVREAAAGDPILFQRVDALLKAHEEANPLLDGDRLVPTGDIPEPSEQIGTVIGPYKLLEQIGEGGMGLVFVAEQQQPVKRRVALKVIKPGMDSRQVIARFQAERQALAMMDHPHIAKVHDGGTTPDGRPFFVMELVKGTPITDYCDAHRLSTRQRLHLFLDVCHAVQHAHQKGIIHRDLKPSNLLVSHHDVRAVVKVIDFGVAKAIGQQLTERSIYTGFAQMIGTPLYMSPEQAGLSDLDVDTRSDVYSLGVLLYELLTSTTPFDNDTLRKAGYDEMRRIIREDEPPKPSSRLYTLEGRTLATIADNRGATPAILSTQLRGELDWIVMKALEKDRDRRYESASTFAADVQHYLNDEAVTACPPSASYRLRKFARRNRRPLVTAGVIVLALVAASVVSVWQAMVARDAQHQAEADRDRAEAAEGRATQEAAIARAVSNFLQEDLLRQVNNAPQDGRERKGNPNLTVKEALDRAAAKVAERFRKRPLVEAAIRTAIGEAYSSLDERRLAAQHLERALELRQVHLGPNHPETIRVMQLLADAYTWIGRCSDAIVMYEQLLENAKIRLQPDDPVLLDWMSQLATAYRRAGDWQRAKLLFEQIVAKDETLRGPTLAGASDHAEKLALIYQDAGMYSESIARVEQFFACRIHLGSDPDDLLLGYDERFLSYQRTGRLDEADRLLRRRLELCRKRMDSRGQIWQARTLEMLSLNVLLQNRPAEAESLAREALTIYEKNHPTDREWRLPYLMNLLGGTLLGQKKYAEAEPLLVQGYEEMKQGEATMTAQWRFRLTEAGERVVRYYEETKQLEKARQWREKVKPAPHSGP